MKVCLAPLVALRGGQVRDPQQTDQAKQPAASRPLQGNSNRLFAANLRPMVSEPLERSMGHKDVHQGMPSA